MKRFLLIMVVVLAILVCSCDDSGTSVPEWLWGDWIATDGTDMKLDVHVSKNYFEARPLDFFGFEYFNLYEKQSGTDVRILRSDAERFEAEVGFKMIADVGVVSLVVKRKRNTSEYEFSLTVKMNELVMEKFDLTMKRR